MECKNCHTPLQSAYCPQCGQKANVSRITLGHLLRELPHAVFHVDRGFLFNFVQLFQRPAPAIGDYLEGKRKPFFHPASYLVLALVLNFVIVKIIDLHFFDAHELAYMDPQEAAAIQAYDQMQWWFLEHTYIYILLAIPISSLFLWGIFWRSRQHFNFAESGVIVLFVIAQGVLIQSLIYLAVGWYPSGVFRRTIELINSFVLVLYASWVIHGLLTATQKSVVRWALALPGGIGLFALWLASAYLLFKLLGN